jgi:hypothetical protein
MLHTKVADKIKTHKFRSVPPPPRENRAFYERTWKNTLEPDGKATDDNMAQVHCMLDT